MVSSASDMRRAITSALSVLRSIKRWRKASIEGGEMNKLLA